MLQGQGLEGWGLGLAELFRCGIAKRYGETCHYYFTSEISSFESSITQRITTHFSHGNPNALPKKKETMMTVGFLYRAGAETPFLNFRENFPISPRTILETFLSGGYPNRSSGIHRGGLDLSTGYPNTYFSWFSGYPQLTLVCLPGDENFRIFS